MDVFYSIQVVSGVLRLLGWFILLFGVLAPLIIPNIPRGSLYHRLMYSWVGLGGTIILGILILVQLHLYDFISIALLLIFIPFGVHLQKYRKQGYSTQRALRLIYDQLLLKQVEALEQLALRNVRNKISTWLRYVKNPRQRSLKNLFERVMVVLLVLGGAVIRFYPALENASPFTRNWYETLNRVKELSLQQYFGISMDPGGLHVMVNFFSKLTQVSPELILHLLGSLTSMLISIWIYGILKTIINREDSVAPLAGMAIYALAPALVMPLSLEQQVEPNTIDFALSFALPVFILWVRNIRFETRLGGVMIYVGFIATAVTNIFVFSTILLPGLLVTGFLIRGGQPFKKRLEEMGKIMALVLLIVLVYWAALWVTNGPDLQTFLREQLFSTQFFTYFPQLWLPLERLVMVYGGIALLIMALIGINPGLSRRNKELQIYFGLIFIAVSLLFIPEIGVGYNYVDLDQLSSFYAVLVAILGGLLVYNLSALLSYVGKEKIRLPLISEGSLILLGLGYLFYLQGGIQTSNLLPQTLPNGYFYSYYKIIDDNLPYTYATVGPKIDSTLSKNRHYFMDYQYFLNNYASIDSLYHKQLLAPEINRETKTVPPASIFVFVAKPPYNDIQKGILSNPGSTMENLRQWLAEYDNKEGREVRIFNDYNDATVYELVNRENEARIDAILNHIFPYDKD